MTQHINPAISLTETTLPHRCNTTEIPWPFLFLVVSGCALVNGYTRVAGDIDAPSGGSGTLEQDLTVGIWAARHPGWPQQGDRLVAEESGQERGRLQPHAGHLVTYADWSGQSRPEHSRAAHICQPGMGSSGRDTGDAS